ncbi:MAG: T9SS type A sorting domain-containing protein [Bacteroidales bacterium]|jgi:predicted outer membrane repeat protein|nr:T9SS type A sorting domain-containing protein [Bacteroidales bacterium]
MKKRICFISAFLFLLINVAFNQTVIPAGEVFGNWLKSASPYLIEGEINVPLNQTLEIEAGVTVKFNGHFKFNIYGCLLANGTLADSIRFSTDDHETGWHGIRFIDTESNTQPASSLSYCIIEYGKSFGTCPDNSGGGIYIGHSNPIIRFNTIRNNTAFSGISDWGGGGIYSEYSNPEIRDNLITQNYSGHDGGGIYCGYGSPIISDNRIIDNEAASRGAGIACFNFSAPDILRNAISDNSANQIGGGIYLSGNSSLVQSNIIQNNYASDGGGIACFLSNPNIYNNLIRENEAVKGAGIWNQGSSPYIFNNTIINNMAIDYGGGMYNIAGMAGVVVYSNPLTANNIIYLNDAEEGKQLYSNTDNVPTLWYNDIEGLTGDGIYGEVNEEEGNFDYDPLFDTLGEHDCALMENSMCIDNGVNTVSNANIPLPEMDILGNKRIWDGDSDGMAAADMGAYEFGSSPLGFDDIRPTFATDIIISPNPFKTSSAIKYELKQNKKVILTIYNQTGKQVYQTEENQSQGNQQLIWNADDFVDGIYYFRLQIADEIAIGKMVKVR